MLEGVLTTRVPAALARPTAPLVTDPMDAAMPWRTARVPRPGRRLTETTPRVGVSAPGGVQFITDGGGCMTVSMCRIESAADMQATAPSESRASLGVCM